MLDATESLNTKRCVRGNNMMFGTQFFFQSARLESKIGLGLHTSSLFHEIILLDTYLHEEPCFDSQIRPRQTFHVIIMITGWTQISNASSDARKGAGYTTPIASGKSVPEYNGIFSL